MMGIVGLKQNVNDEIINLIAKFVGVKPHPLAEILEKEIKRNLKNVRNPLYTATDALHFLLVMKKKKTHMFFTTSGKRTKD